VKPPPPKAYWPTCGAILPEGVDPGDVADDIVALGAAAVADLSTDVVGSGDGWDSEATCAPDAHPANAVATNEASNMRGTNMSTSSSPV
jgi:hypothetical protein